VLHGETGLLAPADDVAALQLAIDRLRTDAELRFRLGRAAQRHAFNELTADVMADRYVKVIGL
jgi:glycosyltransferase involved in cell wall biosynthesis